jgi:predicted TIM-barrel fold metal-dependent hydrolase
MAIIDFSAYYGLWPYWKIQHTTPSDLLGLLDKWGIDQAVVVSTRSIFFECRQGNEDVVQFSRESQGRVHGFAVVNAAQENDALDILQSAHQAGMRGFRLFPQQHRYHLDDDPCLNDVLALGQELGMTLAIPIRSILHWGLPQLDVREIDTVARNFPQLRVVIGGVNYGEFRDALAVLRRHENVCFETSCMQMVNGIETLVKKVGAERVFMGTNLPLMYPYPGIYKIQKAQISDREKELIMGGNAARVLAGADN